MTAGTFPERPLPSWAILLVLVSLAAGILMSVARADLPGAVFFVSYTGIGAFLVTRRPANSVGWLLMLTGWGLAIGSLRCNVPLETLLAGRLDPGQALSAWGNGTGWSLAFIGLTGIALVFPSGRLPSGRSRWLASVALGGVIAISALLVVGPTITVTVAQTGASVDVPNPLAVLPDARFWVLVPEPVVLYATLFGVLVAALVWLGARYRRAASLERLQYRWLVAAIGLVAVATGIWAANQFWLNAGTFSAGNVVGDIVVLFTYPAVPLAIAVAVLRYRLYEIDRIISRSIAYALVSAILASVFVVGVVLLSTILASFAEGQTLAVAGSTFVAFAVAQPLLGRVRRAVDRRFDRTRYDHERTVADFSARLRDEINVDAVTDDLAATTRAAVAPKTLSLWLRSGEPTR
jgi:hypothetical protein